MRRAFTLLELMVVVGIMSFLGLAAANGYSALKRGMADRGAVDAMSSLLLAAKERALVDRVPTVVYCWNRCVREATVDDNAVVVGEAVAVRRAGRITKVSGAYLYDEFGDLDVSYEVEDDQGRLAQRRGFRLWQIPDNGASGMKYSIVADGVFEDSGQGVGVSFLPLADGDVQNISSNIDIRACAFYDLGTSRKPPGSWKVGTAYGLEFQKLRLPDGFVFGNQIPQSVGDISEVNVNFYFDPESIGNAYGSGGNGVEISYYRPGPDGNPEFDHKAGVADSGRRTAQ